MVENVSAHKTLFQTSDFIAYGTIILSGLMEYLFPTSLGVNRVLESGIGLFLLITAWLILVVTKLQFKKCKQPSKPGKVTTGLVTSGILSYSRNPMYVGVVLLVVAIGILADSLWITGSSLIVFLLIQKFLIRPEEKYLTEKFSEDFISYTKHTRRWL